jgi:mannosyl-3-phosphoglycerate phosphatase
VLSSSKTRAEILLYRERLGNRDPFISENGGGVFIPIGYFPFETGSAEGNGYSSITMGRDYGEIRRIFKEVTDGLNIAAPGFGDMTPVEIAAITGLSTDEAALAREREFDEPFIIGEKDLGRAGELLEAIEGAGLKWTRGRFYHILGDNDKGRAAGVLKGFFQRALGDVKTIGLGDGLNDVPLLRAVDYPVLVQNADGGYNDEVRAEFRTGGLIKAGGIGPAGWNSAVLEIIKG